ncbi:winged helix-turn-helix transcriptional regulator [Candidatus Wolfebacteria bacterium]|nr:winged helix-turn-helix transcriptional regulator [Candidatus Wolfebacteria bacterium]
MFISSNIEQSAELLKFLGDTTRLKILNTLFSEGKEMCVNEIADAVGASQSATSHQLARLEALNILCCFRDGQKVCYEFTSAPIVESVKNILKIV